MTETLLVEAFEKAGILCDKSTLNARSVFLAELLTEEYKCSITDKSLRRYYKKENNPKKEVLDGLAQFLDFNNYVDFVKARNPDLLNPKPRPVEKTAIKKKNEGKEEHFKKFNVALLILVGLFLVTGSYHAFVKESSICVRWTGEHYEAVSCSGHALEIPFRQDLLDNFRKIVVTDTTQFFTGGKPQIWYFKSGDQLEYFSAPGLHPVNGKTLKPITPYMINKYVMGEQGQ